MMGDKKLSIIRAQLRKRFAEEGVNPIAALDRRLRRLQKEKPNGKEPRALRLLRNALSQVVDDQPRGRPPAARGKARVHAEKRSTRRGARP
jgi:hypothetical protein